MNARPCGNTGQGYIPPMQTLIFSKDYTPADLPAPVAVYLAAEKEKDTEMLALCFAEDARVFDEKNDHRGIAAIQAWKREANAKYNYVMEPLEATVDGDTVKLRTRLTGDFPGSPVEPDFTFTLAGGRIVSLEID